MVKFETYSNKFFSFSREDYLNFLDEDSPFVGSWKGISIQISNDYFLDDETKIERYNALFIQLLIKLNFQKIIVSHEYYPNKGWFIKETTNFNKIKNIFSSQNVNLNFQGVLIMDLKDLLVCSKDFIAYPYKMSYLNLDFSSTEKIVIKVSNHLNIDIIFENQNILNRLTDIDLDTFQLIEYKK